MTGTVPNFVDVILNFGSKPLNNDNLLLQAKRQKHLLVFYGDNTWLSLFPRTFERYEGTTSFFVKDFTEVIGTIFIKIIIMIKCYICRIPFGYII